MAKIIVFIDGTLIQGSLEGKGLRGSRAWGEASPDCPAKAARPRRSESEAQRAHRQLFKEAQVYAAAVMSDPALRAHYESAALASHKRPRNLAVSDYFKRQKRSE